MAFLRPIRHKLLQGATTIEEMKASEVRVNETPYLERYETAKKLFDEDKTISHDFKQLFFKIFLYWLTVKRLEKCSLDGVF